MKTNTDLNINGQQTFLCKVCGNIDSHPIFQIREMMFGTQEKFEYFQCKSCDCLQILEIPINLEQYYPSSYYSFQTKIVKQLPSKIKKFLQKQRVRSAIFAQGQMLSRLLRPFVKYPQALYRCGDTLRISEISGFDDAFLDVGCGSHSWWLNALDDLGFSNLLGADPFIEKDCTNNRISILKASIQEVFGQFNLVTFHHSFEHVSNPLETLTAAQKLLSSNGTCLLRIPIVSSEAWEKYKTNWVELDAPRHLFLHSIQSISHLANRAGLKVFKTVYETDEFEIYGSKQYELDIPLMADNSYFVSPDKSIFSEKDILSFRKHAKELNRTCRAGRAAFYMRRA